jgi:hypothetical protein
MSETNLTPKQLTALEALLGGATNSAAADAAGVNRCTLRQWRSQPEFQAAMRYLQSQRADTIRNQFAALADCALEAVRKILADETTAPALRLKAALSIIQAASTPPPHPVQIGRTKGDDLDRLFSAAYRVAHKELTFSAAEPEPEPEPEEPQPGAATARNAPCPCGSGLKHKRCCGIHAGAQDGGATRQNPPKSATLNKVHG